MTVLVVASGDPGLATAAEMLRSRDIEIRTTPLPAAFDVVSRGEPRVVIVDLSTGPRAWELVAASVSSVRPARVIALTSSPPSAALRREAYGAGVWELLHAPSARGPRAALVARAVERALAGEFEPSILLVDGCPEVVDGLEALISEEGYRVDTAQTTEQAIEMMRSSPYSLVVTESRRVGPDGPRVIREAARTQQGVPVVVLTASLSDETFLRAVELGASACIWKLADPEEILRELRLALRERAPRGSRPMTEDR